MKEWIDILKLTVLQINSPGETEKIIKVQNPNQERKSIIIKSEFLE